jgi:hypothetical protein
VPGCSGTPQGAKDYCIEYRIDVPEPPSGSFFTIGVMPDTQYMSEREKLFDGYLAMTRFWADHQDDLNLKFVISLGDMTQNRNNRTEWRRAREAYDVLVDAGIPFAPCQGNHDSVSSINEYFPVSEFRNRPNSRFAGHRGGIHNAYYLLSAQGMDIVIVVLEMQESTNERSWANTVFEDHSDRIGILASHRIGVAGGRTLETKVLDEHDNVLMGVQGHEHDHGGQYHWTTESPSGYTQHLMLSNYQDWDDGGPIVRYYTFYPDDRRVCAYTYNTLDRRFIRETHGEFCFDIETPVS